MSNSAIPAKPVIERLRKLCLDLPEATEQETWEAPTFRVRAKIFAMLHQVESRPSVWCKAPKGIQGALVSADPKRYFVPPYVGHNGWVGIRLDTSIDWDELEDLIVDSYRMTAPKRVAALLDATSES
jgi:hypothetical protein